MPRLSAQTLESISPTARPLLEEAVALAGGRLINLHAMMANSCAILASYLGARKALRQYPALDARTGAAIMLAISTVDHCSYSEAIRMSVALRACWSEREASEIRSGAASDAKLAALLVVARQARDMTALMNLLAEEVTFWGDGGGRVPRAATRPISGRSG